MNYFNMSKEELKSEYNKLDKIYKNYKNKNLKLDMSRGKPSKEQLDLSNDILKQEFLNFENLKNFEIDGFDIRNYGCLTGLSSVKKLFSEVFNIDQNNMIIGGNSSLNLMHDIIANSMLFSSENNLKSWKDYKKIKFLCPVPGYDRHFLICEKFGIEMINININKDGPDIEKIEKLVSDDESIKGLWCVPKYSNPTGVTYSDDIVRRLANLTTKANDFKIFWDNAYAIHDLYDQSDNLLNIFEEAKKNNKQDMIYIFYSTSKITFAGAGIAFLVASENNLSKIKSWLSPQTIGFDKINQLRHLLFFKNSDAVKNHMKNHSKILSEKFLTVDKILTQNLSNTNLATWSKPSGGYFISLDTLDGCAKEVVKLCKEAGVIFTPAGATFPYGKDPHDKNIRIAPSYPTIDELITSIELLSLSIKLASIKKLIFNY